MRLTRTTFHCTFVAKVTGLPHLTALALNTRIRISALFLVSLLFTLVPMVVRADSPPEPAQFSLAITPLVRCAPRADRVGLDPSQASCADDAVLRDSNDRIRAAKTDAANAYIATLYKLVPQEKYSALES